MFTELGFLGTKALWFMDFISIYFAVLPFLLFFSIRFAVNKKYKLHLISQSAILAVSLVFVIIFEVGVRISGGFIQYSEHSTLSFDFLFSFLIFHIIFAIFAIATWLYLFFYTLKLYKEDKINTIKNSKHKRLGKIVFLALSLSSIMGILMYIFLFVLIK